MKNKTLIIILAILFAIGSIFLTTGIVFGGETVMYITEKGIAFRESEEPEIILETISNNTKEIEIDVNFDSTISFVSGSDFEISYTKPKFTLTTDENKLKLKQVNTSSDISFGFFRDSNYGDILITIPENITLDKLDISTSVNNLTIDGINVENLNITANVGDVLVKNSNINKLKIKGDIADINIEDCEVSDNVNATTNIGNISFSGTSIKDYANFKINIGDLNLSIADMADDYNINSEIDIGDLFVHGVRTDNNYSFIDGEKQITFEINTGNCELNFENG